nr:serine/threonine-protein kinase [Pseudofrankia sp. EUN1h]
MPPGVEPLDETDPTSLGPYQLLGRLGDGGMGSVYLARRQNAAEPMPTRDGQPLVAVKMIRPDLARIPQFRERFLREAQAARRVARFCTAEVLDVSTDGRLPYLVTEYIDGPTLGEAVHERGPLAATALARLAVAVASALTAIHAAGVVHRDLKPGNILLSSSGARVIDFGIARALDATTMLTHGTIGTPGFMAPEQALGQPAAPAADIYAWGAVVLFAATGRPPFGEGPTPEILRRVVRQTADLSGVPADLRPLVARAMAKDPARRPDADELLLALHHLRAAPRPAPTSGERPTGTPSTPPPGLAGAQTRTRTAGMSPVAAGREDDVAAIRPAMAAGSAGAAAAPGRQRGRWSSRRPLALALALAVAAVVAITAIVLRTSDREGARGPAASSATGTRAATPRTTTADRLARTPPRLAGSPLTGHTGAVNATVFSPDGHTLATASQDGTVRLWNVTNPAAPTALGKPLTGHSGGVENVAFAPDGRLLATVGEDQTVRLWDVTHPASPIPRGSSLTGHTAIVFGVAFSPDGRLLATAANDETVRLWDVANPARPAAVGQPLPNESVYLAREGVAFSPDGHMLVTGSHRWNITDPARPTRLDPPGEIPAYDGVVLSPGGRTLATADSMPGVIRFWNIANPVEPVPLGQPLFILGPAYFAMAFAPDGSTLATTGGEDADVRFWNVTDPAQAREIEQARITRPGEYTGDVVTAVFSPDGSVLATGAAGDVNGIELWTLR